MSVSSMETCVEAALESIAIISQATHQQYLLPIWWYSVYFTFTAALAIYGLQELENERRTFQTIVPDMSPKVSEEHLDDDDDYVDDDDMQQSNAMLGLIQEQKGRTLQTHGNSSVSSFMSHIRNVLDHHLWSRAASVEPSQPINMIQPQRATPSSNPLSHVDVVLPPRRRADHLLDVYWRCIDPLYPFLDRGQMESMYHRLWAEENLGKDTKIFICLLNVVFSLSCNLNARMEPEERTTNAAVFYRRSQALLDFSDVQSRSILTVQCFLLSGQYLQSTNESQQCWMSVGLAIRVAQSIGLDLVETSAGAPTTGLRETMRKVWHGCILMDRTLSMTFGRPLMITPEAAATVPMPLVHDYEGPCSCHSVTFNSEVACERDLHFFTEVLKLYELMGEALLTLYDSSVIDEETKVNEYAVYFGSQAAKIVGQICEVGEKLQRWQRSLPIHLRNDPDAPKLTIYKRQSHILFIRFHHTRILLLRPVLSRFCARQDHGQASFSETLPWKIALHLSISCAKAALETVEFYESSIGNRNIQDCEDLLPAWWYSTFYIYSAATILVAAQVHPALGIEVGPKRTLDGCRVSIKLLTSFQGFGAHAVRCATAIGILLDHVSRKQKGRAERKRRQEQEKSDQDVSLVEKRGPDKKCEHLVNQGALRTRPAKHSMHGFETSTEAVGQVATLISPAPNEIKSLEFGLTIHDGVMDGFPALDGVTAIDFEGFNHEVDFDDFSWLNSIPAQLYGT
ncbi:Zn(2)-C6 fungal-type domain-containing protein [Fusarium sp. LHS14.1]|nr:Zn(2)-C6 fungal-type domain-containing protein [Fusarium sp. LHS14.1]